MVAWSSNDKIDPLCRLACLRFISTVVVAHPGRTSQDEAQKGE